ncbi:MAG TPA: DUF5666 domain-containing protein, partial [Armatimonadota bacterium]|nr:DUF5666 domain-containing protein [Armatimonadota bacterium]
IEVEREDDDEGEAVGEVIAADENSGVVTLDVNNDGVTDLTLQATDQTEVKVGDLRLTAGELDLLEGLTVRVEFDPNNFRLRGIKADASQAVTVTGTVAVVDPNARTLSVQTQNGVLQLQVPVNADIRIDGRSVRLSDVEPGDRVQVTFLRTGQSTGIALQVRVTEAPQPEPRTVIGTITAVNAQAGTLTVQTPDGPLQLQVPANADIRLNGRSATLADLEVGDEARVTYRVNANGTNTVLQIRATEAQQPAPRTVTGTITAVNAQAGTLTLETRDGLLLLQVPANTNIRLDGRSVPLSELRVGDQAQVTYRVNANGTNTALEIRATSAQQPEPLTITGTIVEVNAQAGTLSVDTGNRIVLLQVTGNTDIRLNGRSVSLSALRPGDRVEVTYRENANGTNTALRIRATEGPQPERRHISGILLAASGNTLTVRSANGREVVLTVNNETTIRINGRLATTADLAQALADSAQSGRAVRLTAEYVVDGDTNLATRVQANVRGRGRG